jgi:uncharacterized FlaG/YvyC family protein
MSIQQLNGADTGAALGVTTNVATAVAAHQATTAKAATPTVAQKRTEDRFDAIPSKPPEDVLDQIKAAGERYQQLRSQQRELHFEHDDTTNRVIVQVKDLDGNVLRTIPPSKALDVISGAPLDED